MKKKSLMKKNELIQCISVITGNVYIYDKRVINQNQNFSFCASFCCGKWFILQLEKRHRFHCTEVKKRVAQRLGSRAKNIFLFWQPIILFVHELLQ